MFCSFTFSNVLGIQITDSLYVVSSINIKGNRITNEKVILREFPFKLGDTIVAKSIYDYRQQVKENLDNSQLFNFVYIDYETVNASIAWNVRVEERWYFWPVPILEYSERNLSAFLNHGDYSKVNYGAFITVNNFRGTRDQLTLRFVLGYRKQISLRYSAFSVDKEKRHGFKGWISYVTNYEVPFTSNNNRQVYFKSLDGNVRSSLVSEFSYQYRPAYHWYHTFKVSHERTSVLDTIAVLNPNYFGNGSSNYNVTELSYNVFLEKRNPKVFPLSGYFINFGVFKSGIFANESLSYWHANLSGGYYKPIASRFFAGTDLMLKMSSKSNLPYWVNEAIGYKDYIRGLEYYVTNGAYYIINKNSIKYQILKPKEVILPFIPEGKFHKAHIALYWSIFADSGFVKAESNYTNNLLEGKLLYGYGTGIYLVAYYDIVLRLEYSFNMLGENGIFVHFGTPFLN
jgi:outer membrane protein assembly factor BamA